MEALLTAIVTAALVAVVEMIVKEIYIAVRARAAVV